MAVPAVTGSPSSAATVGFVPVVQVVGRVVLEELGVVREGGVVDSRGQVQAAVVRAGRTAHLVVTRAHHDGARVADGRHIRVAHVALTGTRAGARRIEQVRFTENRAVAGRGFCGDADRWGRVDRRGRMILRRGHVRGRAVIGRRQARVDEVGAGAAVDGVCVRRRNVPTRDEHEPADENQKAIGQVHWMAPL